MKSKQNCMMVYYEVNRREANGEFTIHILPSEKQHICHEKENTRRKKEV